MAVVEQLHGLSAPIHEATEIADFLAPHGIQYEHWDIPEHIQQLSIKPSLSAEDQENVLEAFRDKLDVLAKRDGYVASDMICLIPDMEGREGALGKFDLEHYHDDDEVRFIVDGEGVFGFESQDLRKFLIRVEAGDYIVIPAKSYHWFYMNSGTGIKALRIFKDKTGWTPVYKDAPTK